MAMKCAPSHQSSLRMRAIWTLGRGFGKAEVIDFLGVDYSALMDWIHHFNERGIDGLIEKKKSGRPRKLTIEAVRETILPLVADPSKAGQKHWTAVKLHGLLKDDVCKDLSYSTLVRYMHENGLVLKVPRSMPEPPDRAAWRKQREEFGQKLGGMVNDPTVELWFGEESGIEGDPRPNRRWVQKGSKPTTPYAGTHLRRNVIGAVCPANGQLSCIIFSHCDTQVFQAFLDNMAAEVPKRENRRLILVLDNASWHKTASLNWHHIEPLYLPPYSPDFNPIERFWHRLKADYFSDFFVRKPEKLEARIVYALNSFFKTPDSVASQCAISADF